MTKDISDWENEGGMIMEEKSKLVKRVDFLRKCDTCEDVDLVVIPEVYPYNLEHLQCPECDGTYNIETGEYTDNE